MYQLFSYVQVQWQNGCCLLYGPRWVRAKFLEGVIGWVCCDGYGLVQVIKMLRLWHL